MTSCLEDSFWERNRTGVGVDIDLKLVSFTAHPEIALMGSTWNGGVVLSWEFNKTVERVVVEGVELYGNASTFISTNSITSDYSFSLKGYANGQMVPGHVKFPFLNYAYWGLGSSMPADSNAVKALSNFDFISTKGLGKIPAPAPMLLASAAISIPPTKVITSFTPGTLFPIIAMPQRLGAFTKVKVSQKASGLPQGNLTWVPFTDITSATVSVTNSLGFTENYVVGKFNSLPQDPYFQVQWF